MLIKYAIANVVGVWHSDRAPAERKRKNRKEIKKIRHFVK